MPPKKTVTTEAVAVPTQTTKKTKIESALWQTRELCRKHHLNTWGKESLANQIYQDLLFIYHIPRLCREGILDIEIQRIGDGKISEVSYASLLSLKEPELINASFKRLWKELQRCVLKDLFYGREFTLFTVEKKKPESYINLLLDLFKYFASIELEGYDSNAGYTYFKKDLNKAIAKTFGQFYTPSTVTYSVVKLVDPKIGEKTLDPSCGSCSFLAESANYIVKKEGVDIKTAFADLYGTEVETNIFAEGIMNIFINFGLIPDMKGRIREVDALLDMAKSEDQFEKIVANPPFGADASTFHEFYFKTELESKGKRMVKKIIVNPEVKCQIPFTKTKESAVLFFQFIVEKLKNGGKAGVVMSATILNDGYKEMMEWFLKCCSLEKVVINPAGTFKDQGTGIETFSFIFTKGKPTTTVEIVMLGAEDDAVRTLTLDQIKEAGWKLQLKEEEKKVAYTGGFLMVKLGDVCSFVNGYAFKSEEFIETGVPVLKIKNIKNNNINLDDADYVVGNSKLSSFIVKENDMVISLTGYCGDVGLNRTGKECYLNQRTARIDIISQSVNHKYMYYYMVYSDFINKVREMAGGSAQPNVSTKKIEELNMPLPPLEIQQEIVTNLDRIFADPQDMKDCLAFTDKAMDLMLKDPTGKQLEDVLGGLRLKRAYVNDAASVKSQMAAVVRSVGARGFERKKLGDMYKSVVPKIKIINKDVDNIGTIPFYNGSWKSPVGTHSVASFTSDIPYFIVIKDGGGDHDSSTVGLGMFFNVKGPCAVSGHLLLVPIEYNEVSHKFVHHYLTIQIKKIRELSKRSVNLEHISKESIMEFEIPCPPLPIQHEVLGTLNEMEAELQTLKQMAAKAEQRAKFILDGYLTPAPQAVEAEPVVAPTPKPKKKIVIRDE